MNGSFIGDIEKGLNKVRLNQELSPGSKRRYEPISGLKKHNERIHRESAQSDKHGNLPFTFSKPYKNKGRPLVVKCDNCGNMSLATSLTIGIICNKCHKFSSVTEVEDDR